MDEVHEFTIGLLSAKASFYTLFVENYTKGVSYNILEGEQPQAEEGDRMEIHGWVKNVGDGRGTVWVKITDDTGKVWCNLSVELESGGAKMFSTCYEQNGGIGEWIYMPDRAYKFTCKAGHGTQTDQTVQIRISYPAPPWQRPVILILAGAGTAVIGSMLLPKKWKVIPSVVGVGLAGYGFYDLAKKLGVM